MPRPLARVSLAAKSASSLAPTLHLADEKPIKGR
jgi:hypothetical protein